MNNKEVTNMIDKPMSILREEFIDNLVGLINNSGLPLFVIEPILQGCLDDVKINARNQYEYEKMQYEQALMNAMDAMNTEGEQDDRGKISEEITEDSTEK